MDITDILITSIGVDLLYRNNGNGTFSEVGKTAGLQQKVAWHTGSAFGDADNDGDLDLYIAGYVDPAALTWTGTAPVCQYKGLSVFCGPRNLPRRSRPLLPKQRQRNVYGSHPAGWALQIQIATMALQFFSRT